MKNALLASTSTLPGEEYLEYLLKEISILFRNSREIIFIPYARPGGISHKEYTALVENTFNKIDVNVKGLHEFENPQKAIAEAEGIFTGGGNTFYWWKSFIETEL